MLLFPSKSFVCHLNLILNASKYLTHSLFFSKFGNMKKGQSHVAASPFCDKLVFNKVSSL